MEESQFVKQAQEVVRTLNYTEPDAQRMSVRRCKTVAQVITEQCEEPRLDEVCSLLDLDTSGLDNPARAFTPDDVALAAWSNWGAGNIHLAASQSTLSEGEFVVLNDYFEDIRDLNEE